MNFSSHWNQNFPIFLTKTFKGCLASPTPLAGMAQRAPFRVYRELARRPRRRELPDRPIHCHGPPAPRNPGRRRLEYISTPATEMTTFALNSRRIPGTRTSGEQCPISPLLTETCRLCAGAGGEPQGARLTLACRAHCDLALGSAGLMAPPGSSRGPAGCCHPEAGWRARPCSGLHRMSVCYLWPPGSRTHPHGNWRHEEEEPSFSRPGGAPLRD